MGKASINIEKCIGCGKCVKDCFPKALELISGKAELVEKQANCIECGHCVAVCPVNAVTLEGYDMEEVIPYSEENFCIDPDQYLSHLKLRRSIRQFQDKPVPVEAIKKILEAGRYSPTGGNLQNVSYVVVQDDIANAKQMIFEELNEMGLEARANGVPVSWYSELWIRMYRDFVENGKDELFFGAGTAIVVASNSPQSAIIAASHMETMVYSLGYGMLYSGFTTRAITHSKKLQEYFELENGYQAYAVLVIGEPDVRYNRSVPRKEAKVIWK